MASTGRASTRATRPRRKRHPEGCGLASGFLSPMVTKSDSLRAVSAAANQPPPDIHALEARLAATLAERDAAIIERDAAIQRSDRLAHLLRQLQRMQFGRKSEKLDPDQFALALEDVDQ